MRKLLALFLLLSVFLAGAVLAEPAWVSLNNKSAASQPEVTVLGSDASQSLLRISIPGFYREAEAVEGAVYQRLTFEENFTTREIGRPQLPVLTRLVAVPFDADVRLTVVDQSYTTLTGYRVYPFQTPQTDEGGDAPFEIDKAFYERDAWYPETTASVDDPAIWRDIRVVSVHLNPVQYNPQTGELRILTDVTLRVDYVATGPKGGAAAHSWPINESYDNMYRRAVVNYDEAKAVLGLGETNLALDTKDAYDYLIIAVDEFVDDMQPFITHKNARGISTQIVALSTIGADTALIRNYIQQEFTTNNIQYVLLVGDENYLPCFEGYLYSGTPILSDYYYSLVAGSDNLPDVAVGRFSVTTATQVSNLINKTINFENAPAPRDWVTKCLLVANSDETNYTNCKEAIRASNPYFDYTLAYGINGASNDDISDAINEGQRIVNYRGHGLSDRWENWNPMYESYTTTEINALDNGSLTPIVFSIACNTSQIQVYAETMAEAFTNSVDGGVAFLGATRPTDRQTNDNYDRCLFYAMFLYDINEIGNISNWAMSIMVGGGAYPDIIFAHEYLWLGDPSLNVFPDDFDQIWVDAANGDDTLGTGSYSEPYQTLGHGISVADDGDQVWAMPGTYSGTGNVNLHFDGKEIMVCSHDGPLETIIDCQNSSRAFLFDGGETENAILQGFTIENGYSATNGGGLDITYEFDSMMVIFSHPTIRDCLFRDCQANQGGAIFVTEFSPVTIENCTFVHNTANSGAAVCFGGSVVNTKFNRNIVAYNYGVGIEDISIHGGGDLTYAYNVFYENSGGDKVGFNNNGSYNIYDDPWFCDPDGDDFKLSVYSPCNEHNSACGGFIGAVAEYCDLPYANRGDVNLNYLPWEISDFVTFINWLEYEDSAYTIDPVAQGRASDFNCDGYMQTLADYLFYMRYLNGDWGTDCPALKPLYSDKYEIEIRDTSHAKGAVRRGVDVYLSNNTQLSGLQARITYNRHFMTPHLDTVGGGVVEIERLDKLNGSFALGDVSVIDYSPGELLVYMSTPTDEIPDTYITPSLSPQPALRIFFDISNELYIPAYSDVTPKNRDLRVNHMFTHNAQTIVPLLDGGRVTLSSLPSCPVLYAFDGAQYVVENPLLTACEASGYTDIVTDYYRVTTPVSAADGVVTFQLRELEDETTYLNDLELITVDHNPQSQVACAPDGRIFTYTEVIEPIGAVDNNGNDRLAEIRANDGVLFTSDQAGWLELSYPSTSSGTVGITLGSLPKRICQIFPKVLTDRDLPGNWTPTAPTVEYYDGTGWRSFTGISPRVNPTQEALYSEIAPTGETVHIRITWQDQYATDAVLQFIPDDDPSVIRHHRIAASGVAMAGKARADWNGFGDGAVLELNKGDVFDCAFQTGSAANGGLIRDYIVKATGRYIPVSLKPGDALPKSYALYNNYPNPFNPATTIAYDLPVASHVKLVVYNVLGQVVTTLVDGDQEPGEYQVVWDSKDRSGHTVASGIYFYQIEADDFASSRKMLLLK